MANETILVVDGDTRSRKILEVSFKKSGYRVLMTDTISGAVDYLEEETPDLIVSDTKLPDGDGFEFCRRIKESPDWEYTPFLFLTDESSLPRKIKGIEIGADDYLTRPIYIKEVTTRVDVLLKKRDRELLSEGEVEEFRGELSEITIIDLLQTIDEEGRSGVVEFWRDDRSGEITFRDGRVIDAACGKLRGAEAVYRLMLWPGGRFWVRYHDEMPGTDNVGMSTDELLLEGVRRIERWDEIVGDLPMFDGVYEPDYEKLPGFLDAVPEQVGRVVRLFDGYRTVRDVVDDSPVGDVTAAEIIHRVFGEGILEEADGDREQRASTGAQRSHLANWLESSGEVDRGEFREEDTSPGYPSSAKSGDPHETQEIERDDLTTALSDKLDEEEEAEREQAEEPPGAFEQEDLDPNESGPRYMPDEREETKRGYAEVEGTPGEPAPVDETLDELEEAERKRRKEEAKRLVEQKHEPGAEVAAGVARGPESERRAAGGDDAPRIPGATKTRGAAEASSPSTAPSESDEDEGESTQPGQRRATDEPAAEEPSDRGRSNTPRAHPTADEDSEEQEAPSPRSRKQTESGIGETGLEQGEESGVPVSFETVGSGGGDAAPSEAPSDQGEPDSGSETAESTDQSMTEEAAEAVRQSARQALEDAAFDSDEWSEESDEESGTEPAAEEGGRERKDTSPYGDKRSSEPKTEEPADAEPSEPAEPESPTEPESPAAQMQSPVQPQESVDEPPEVDETSEAARPPETDAETAKEGESEPSEQEVPDDIERISNNGEVVRTEYDLSGPRPEDEEAAPSSDTLEGVSRKPEPADETIESDETLEGVAPEPKEDAGSSVKSEPESAPSDDTLDGFSGVSGEVTLEEETEQTQFGPDRQPSLEPPAAEDESDDEEGLEWDAEPTARDLGWASEQREAMDSEEESAPEPEPEETAAESEDSSDPAVRIESEAFALSEEPEEIGAEAEEVEEVADADQSDEAMEWDEAAAEADVDEAPESSEVPPAIPDEPEEVIGRSEAPSDETPKVDDEAAPESEAEEPDGEAQEEADEVETEQPLDDLTASSGEASFFEEPEQEEEYDWEEVESEGRGGTWAIVTVVLVVAGIAGVAFALGPFSDWGGSESDSEKSSEAVAKSDEPKSPEADEEAAGGPSESEEPSEGSAEGPPVPKVETKGEAKRFSKNTAAAVGEVARRKSRILAGDDPYLSAPTKADAGDVGVEGDAGPSAPEQKVASQQGGSEPSEPSASTSQPSASSSGGGSVSSQISRVRRLIRNGELSEAQSTLRDLEEQAPGRSDVARLYLNLASKLQLNGQTQQAKSAYQSYLDIQPDGPRADEVRSILDRL